LINLQQQIASKRNRNDTIQDRKRQEAVKASYLVKASFQNNSDESFLHPCDEDDSG